DQVDRPAEHPLGAEQRDQIAPQRLGRSGGELVGRAVSRRRARRAPDAARVRCEQWRAPAQASAIPAATSTCTSRGPSCARASGRAPWSSSRPATRVAGTLSVRAVAATSRRGRSRAGAPVTFSSEANHFRIEYSLLRRTRNLTGVSGAAPVQKAVIAYCAEPSPSTHTPWRCGWASCTPSAAESPNPSPPLAL